MWNCRLLDRKMQVSECSMRDFCVRMCVCVCVCFPNESHQFIKAMERKWGYIWWYYFRLIFCFGFVVGCFLLKCIGMDLFIACFVTIGLVVIIDDRYLLLLLLFPSSFRLHFRFKFPFTAHRPCFSTCTQIYELWRCIFNLTWYIDILCVCVCPFPFWILCLV